MDLQDLVAITLVPGISRARAAAVFKALREQDAAVTLDDVIEAGVSDADTPSAAARSRAAADALLAAAAAAAIDAVGIDDERYPALLRTIIDPPPVLWIRGDGANLARPAVAIVGSRAASPYAVEVAWRLGGELADRGLVVVSGLARGADGAAHRGCLHKGGQTIAVLGCGPDVVYPAEHRTLAAQIAAEGVIVSELGAGAPPLPEHFPQRNRLISGISLAVVVVEANEKSGSLITAKCALEQGRDVMAVPGSVLGGRNRGSHALLKDGAKVVETADDILEELGWGSPAGTGLPLARALSGSQISCKYLTDNDLLGRLTPGEVYGVEQMSATLEIPGPALLPQLAGWELRGQLVKVAGGRYKLA